MKMATKIRYIETKPIQQTIDFNTKEEYNEFVSKRIREILDYTYPNNQNFYDYFHYERVLFNKNGVPRKISSKPEWLWTKEAQKKQKEGFTKWCEIRKKQTEAVAFKRKRAEIEAKIEFWKGQLQEFEQEHLEEN